MENDKTMRSTHFIELQCHFGATLKLPNPHNKLNLLISDLIILSFRLCHNIYLELWFWILRHSRKL